MEEDSCILSVAAYFLNARISLVFAPIPPLVFTRFSTSLSPRAPDLIFSPSFMIHEAYFSPVVPGDDFTLILAFLLIASCGTNVPLQLTESSYCESFPSSPPE